jgi:hypothetical protein
MPTLSLVFLTFLTAPAFAQVNHGDFLGTSVDFLDVTETTQSPGDAAVLWDTPSLAGNGDQLLFLPPGFSSSCTAGGSDVTSSLLTMDIAAQPGGHIETLTLVESGDTVLGVFPPYGTSATNTSVTMSGTLTITETTSGPIAPVVIPWSGTFTPTGDFELPGDFGTNTWDGRVDIDVASVVPLATTATLAWDNTLAANCGAGSTNALIQKKVVNGPVVAIMVNPLECDLEVDKTCCVPQPVLPDLDICQGDVVRMLLEYTGDKCSASTNEQGKKFRCYGRRELGEPATIQVLDHWGASPVVATPSSGVLIGDTVELTSSTGIFPDRTKLKVSDDWSRRQYLKIDTSGDRAIRCNDQFGAFKVVGLESTLGGFVDCTAPPPPPTCDAPGDPVGTPCDAKVVDMVLEYTGTHCQNPLPNPQNGEASCSGDSTGAIDVGIVYSGKFGYKQIISPASNVNDGDRIRVTSTWQGGLFPNQEYLITDASGVLQEVAFHTSCSQPFALGDRFGPFTVVEMTTKNGTQLTLGDGSDGTADACEVPLAPPTPHCTSDLEALTLVYIGDFLGEGCTVSNSQGGYASCAGVADPGELVAVTPGSGLMADPVDNVEFGDLVTFTNTTAGQELPAYTTLDVTGSGGTQSISFKTSCHKPLSLGDRFGSFVVFAMDREDDGPISLGGEILYQYKVTNPNAVAVDNVIVDDSELGEIASGVSIPAGETVTFSRAATLYGTTTNVATANGDVNGDVCDPGSDSVTVDVKVPPQGSFTCSCNTSMTELTVIWDQVGTVDVKVWDGPIGSTLLTEFFGLQKGDQITVGPFTAEDSEWEITDSVSGFPIGKSIFKLTCWDQQMNGVEDCGKRQGNGKYDDPVYLNKWILEGMADDDESLVCTPTVVVPPGSCGLGPELLVVLPGLLWLHRRRQRLA